MRPRHGWRDRAGPLTSRSGAEENQAADPGRACRPGSGSDAGADGPQRADVNKKGVPGGEIRPLARRWVQGRRRAVPSLPGGEEPQPACAGRATRAGRAAESTSARGDKAVKKEAAWPEPEARSEPKAAFGTGAPAGALRALCAQGGGDAPADRFRRAPGAGRGHGRGMGRRGDSQRALQQMDAALRERSPGP